MSLATKLLHDQFISVASVKGGKRFPAEQYVALASGFVTFFAIRELEVQTQSAPALLTATSILTGLIFTMAMRFWERSVDLRKDEDDLAQQDVVATVDRMRSQLIWTVFSGILSTGWLASLAFVFASSSAPVWASAIAGGLFVYQLVQVGAALFSLYMASYTMRSQN